MFFREKKSNGVSYLQVVENRWENGKCKQRVVATLGRLEELKNAGHLESLSASAARFSQNLALLSAHRKGETVEISRYRVGSQMVFDRLWRSCGCRNVMRAAGSASNLDFDFEKAVFLMVLHQLLDTDLNRPPVRWAAEYRFDATERLDLSDMDRAVVRLGTEPKPSRKRTRGKAREESVKRRLERFRIKRLATKRVAGDTAFIYVVPISEPRRIRRRSIRSRPSHARRYREASTFMGVALDSEGLPITYEVSWARDANDGRLKSLVRRLRKEMGFERVIVIADREVIGFTETARLEKESCGYIVGEKRRRRVGSRRDFPSLGRSLVDVTEQSGSERNAILRNAETGSEQVTTPGPTSRKCRHSLEASTDEDDQESKRPEDESFLHEKRILEKNTGLAPVETDRLYRQLENVKGLCRGHLRSSKTAVSVEESRNRARGQACCSFLALLLAKELERRLRRRGPQFEWRKVVKDLDRLRQVEVEYGGERYLVRGPVGETCGRAFQAVGAALPPEVKKVTSVE